MADEKIAINVNNIENTEQIIGQLMDNYSDDVLHLVFSYVKNVMVVFPSPKPLTPSWYPWFISSFP